MTDHVMEAGNRDPGRIADKALKLSAQFWFLVMAVGQWIFVAYLMVSYGVPALLGNFDAWNEASANSLVAGDTLGNTAFVFHILLAVVIIGGGPLQLIPRIRAKFPTFHRWNGRAYIATSIISSIAGLYMIWTRDIPGGLVLRLGISFDAVLIFVFSILAWRSALKGDFARHRRWALRLFMVVSAVWFFRVGFMAWVMIHQAPVGFDPDTFTGPFVTIWSFAQYLLPLTILELYFLVQKYPNTWARFTMAAGLFIATLVMGVGIAGAVFGMWFPVN